MSTPFTVLVVDDEAFVRESTAEILEVEGFHVLQAGSGREALEVLESGPLHAIVTDLRMAGGGGQELLVEARRRRAGIPVVVVTGVGTVQDAVAALKAGAFDFLQKPVDPAHLARIVRRAVEHQELVTEVQRLRGAVDSERGSRRLVGRSEVLGRVRALIGQVAPADTSVLISGESGTGKELAAEEIHRSSPRSGGPLVRVQCAALHEALFESELFGHRRGAFPGAESDRVGRFEEADRGTLVLDHVDSLKLDMQAKLLGALESGEFQVPGESRPRRAHVRLVALTGEDLQGRVQAGAFRADLFFRIHVFPIAMPPLRQHKEDLEEIASDLLERIQRALPLSDSGPAPGRLDAAAVDVLASYDWPGNVRELANVLERAVILAGRRAPDAQVLRGVLESSLPLPAGQEGPGELHLRRNLDAVEKQLILRALERAEGRKKEAAFHLGVDPRNLGYYLRKHGLAR